MNFPRTIIALHATVLLVAGLSHGEDKDGGKAKDSASPLPGKRSDIQFSFSPRQSSDPLEIRYRLMAAEDPPPYDVKNETYEILLPASYQASKSYGAFIWISAGNLPSIQKEWEAVLDRNDLIFIGAKNSGNPRNVFDRIRLAIDANHNLRERFPIDGRRVYVSGFSGGSRVASMLGVAWGDMFSGTICCMGVNFYTDISAPDGKIYGLSYLPNEELLPLVKEHCRFALITGEKDFNRPNTLGVFENGFLKENFQHAKTFLVSNHGHQPPPAETLEEAIRFLDEKKQD